MFSVLRDNIYFRAHRSHLYMCFPGVLHTLLTPYQLISQNCDFGRLVLVLYQTILCHKQTFSSYLSIVFLFIYDYHEQPRFQHKLLWDSTSNLHALWKLIIHVLCFLFLNQSIIHGKAFLFIICLVSLRVSYKG